MYTDLGKKNNLKKKIFTRPYRKIEASKGLERLHAAVGLHFNPL